MGGVNGLAQIVEKTFCVRKKEAHMSPFIKGLKVCLVFCFCSFAWVFFRADSINDAIYVFAHIFDEITHVGTYIVSGIRALSIPNFDMRVIIFSCVVLFLYDLIDYSGNCIETISKKKAYIRWPIYIALVLAILFFAPTDSSNQFVYFQF